MYSFFSESSSINFLKGTHISSEPRFIIANKEISLEVGEGEIFFNGIRAMRKICRFLVLVLAGVLFGGLVFAAGEGEK